MSKLNLIRSYVRKLLQPHEVSPEKALTVHFFGQFFQSDNPASVETPVVRALAAVATPMLMAGFWIVTLARGLQPWSAAGIHYVFVLYAFCAMGCVTTLQWDRLFPERLDFLVLLPMPLRGRTIFSSKLRAVAAFLTLFLFAANISGTLLIPVLAGWRLPLAMVAHGAAVFSAGIASALGVLALESMVIALTPERWFRYIAPIVQTILIAAFLTLFLRMGTVMEALPTAFSGSNQGARWFPPLWFLAIYECGMGGPTATAFVQSLARQAWTCLPVLFVLVVMLYPAAWARRRHMALEGTRSARLRDGRLWDAFVHRTVLQMPDTRAVFHFMRQTLTRLSRYHMGLAAYAGAGLALSLTFAMGIEITGGMVHVALVRTGVQAVLPLLLFWTVAGLRAAFLLPADLGARWIFRLAGLRTQRVISTTKLFVLAACCAVIALVMMALVVCGWRGSDLVLQAIYGTCCAVLLVDLFFFLEAHVPFTRPALPGRSSLPMTLALYVFGVPVLVLLMVTLERWAGNSPWRAAETCSAAAGVHILMHWLRVLPSHPVSEDAFLDESSEEVQTLGLST